MRTDTMNYGAAQKEVGMLLPMCGDYERDRPDFGTAFFAEAKWEVMRGDRETDIRMYLYGVNSVKII